MKYFLTFCLIIFIPFLIFAQKVKKVHGEYLYVVPENVTLEQAKQIAIDKAKIQAIEAEFGAIVSQDNYLKISNKQNGDEIKSETDFLSLGGSNVKGEWVEDITPPTTEILYDKNCLAIKANVYGTIKEITSSKIDLDIKILCNGTESIHEKTNFKNGDNLYISVKSPTKGYIAIYLVDESNSAYCLLPYRKMQNGNIPIEANYRYTFFSKKHILPNIKSNKVDSYQLFCQASEEKNQLYIIFSTNPLIKPNDNETQQTIDGLKMPRNLSFNDFYKWLSKNKLRDNQMQVEIKNIIITK